MRIDRNPLALLTVLCLVVGLHPRGLGAATIEVESDDEDVATPTALPSRAPVMEKKAPTPVPTPIAQISGPTPVPTTRTEKPMGEEKEPGKVHQERVRVSDKVNFFNFVAAGYLATDPALVHGVGTIVQTGKIEQFTTGQHPAVEVNSERYAVKKGDLFIVYRCDRGIQEPHSGFLGYQVENLALVEVVEAQKTRHVVEVKKSFKPFQPGDRVIPYENEVRRWKQAQVKKPLPSHPVAAYVAAFDEPRTNFSSTDPILITAGSKKGVVEGQKFSLFRDREGEFEKEDLDLRVGSARVLYAGPDYSIAVILNSNEPIQAGFKADYRP